MWGRTEASSVPSGRGLDWHRLLGWGPVVPGGCATFTTGYVPGSLREHWGRGGRVGCGGDGFPRGRGKQQAGRMCSMLRTSAGDLFESARGLAQSRTLRGFLTPLTFDLLTSESRVKIVS